MQASYGLYRPLSNVGRMGIEYASTLLVACEVKSPWLSMQCAPTPKGLALDRTFQYLGFIRANQSNTKSQGDVRSTSTTDQGRGLNQLEQGCWSCNHRFQKGGFVCSGCEKIQPLDSSLNYFELLGMPSMQYSIDLANLEQQYKRRQWMIHPDRLARHSQKEQSFSAEAATRINMAYSVLRNPLSRANYMLTQRGIISEDESEASTIHDVDFLNEVMEAREQVEEAQSAAVLQDMLSLNRSQQQDLVARLCKAFDSPSGSREAVELTVRLTYLHKLEAEIIESDMKSVTSLGSLTSTGRRNLSHVRSFQSGRKLFNEFTALHQHSD